MIEKQNLGRGSTAHDCFSGSQFQAIYHYLGEVTVMIVLFMGVAQKSTYLAPKPGS
jgi:hypothetical protein